MRQPHGKNNRLYTAPVVVPKYSLERIKHRCTGESNTPVKPQTNPSMI